MLEEASLRWFEVESKSSAPGQLSDLRPPGGRGGEGCHLGTGGLPGNPGVEGTLARGSQLSPTHLAGL